MAYKCTISQKQKVVNYHSSLILRSLRIRGGTNLPAELSKGYWNIWSMRRYNALTPQVGASRRYTRRQVSNQGECRTLSFTFQLFLTAFDMMTSVRYPIPRMIYKKAKIDDLCPSLKTSHKKGDQE
jgi:hypothetical protein